MIMENLQMYSKRILYFICVVSIKACTHVSILFQFVGVCSCVCESVLSRVLDNYFVCSVVTSFK